jgi:hypothetical protein
LATDLARQHALQNPIAADEVVIQRRSDVQAHQGKNVVFRDKRMNVTGPAPAGGVDTHQLRHADEPEKT